MATEKRLIDANALLEKFQFRMEIDNKNAEIISGCVDIARRIINNEPTVDAVPVVRCKDCKYRYYHNIDEQYYCNMGCGLADCVNPEDFCSYGERKAE